MGKRNNVCGSLISPNADSNDPVINLDTDDETTELHKCKKRRNIVQPGNGECPLKLGMAVYSEEEAYDLYNTYAVNLGFSVRKDQIRYKHGTKEIRERTYLCHKEGFRNDTDNYDKSCERLETRTGCNARIIFKVENGMWKIDKFIEDHNHALVAPEHRHMLRSGRKIPDSTKGVIDSMVDVGIGPTKARNYIAKEAGGFSHVTFTASDCNNYVQSRRSKLLEPNDAQTLINHFKTMQAQNPMFFYATQLDEENRLTNFFWMDARSRIDVECFKDVVIFDTTFRTNRYKMVCAPFVGVNHHWQNVLLGCAFLLDETISSFVWLFKAFKEAIGKAPTTIFTDQDQAMASVIAIVFPGICHRLCDWHISKNAAKRIPHLYGKSEFKKKFNKCFYACDTKEDFEQTWKEMIEEWNASENTWLKNLYGLKDKWCPAFSNDFFSANIKSTQRSESMNNVFHRITCKTATLTEFVKHYEENAEQLREAERIEDFRCTNGKPSMRVFVGILNHAAEVYTCKIFGMFLREFDRSVAEKIVEHTSDGNSDVYTLQKEGCQSKHVVEFNSSEVTISCSCKKFETMGLLCCHALRILNVKTTICKIPEKYILKRWTKFAKDGLAAEKYFEPAHRNAKESKTICLSRLMRKAFIAMDMATLDEKTIRMAEENLDQLVHNLIKHKETLVVSADANSTSNVEPKETLLDKPTVLNPPYLRGKGETNARIKGREEKGRQNTTKAAPKVLQSNTKTKGGQNGKSTTIASSRVPLSTLEFNLSSTPLPNLPQNNIMMQGMNFPSVPFSSMTQHGMVMPRLNQGIDFTGYMNSYNFAPPSMPHGSFVVPGLNQVKDLRGYMSSYNHAPSK